MATVANPLWTSMVPGASPVPVNPTGTNINIPGMGSTSSGSNPLLPATGPSTAAPTSGNPAAAGFPANSGAYGPTSLTTPVPGTPTTNVGQAAASPIGGMNTMSPTDLSRMFSSLKAAYGDGTAHAIMNFLTSGAGFNQEAINNMLAALQPGIERGTESLMEQFSASGNRFGSGAQIGLGDYLSQVQLNEGQLETQMYEQAINNYMNVLTGTASQEASLKANSPSMMDTLMQAFGLAKSGAGAAGGLSGLFGGLGGGGGALAAGGADAAGGSWVDLAMAAAAA